MHVQQGNPQPGWRFYERTARLHRPHARGIPPGQAQEGPDHSQPA